MFLEYFFLDSSGNSADEISSLDKVFFYRDFMDRKCAWILVSHKDMSSTIKVFQEKDSQTLGLCDIFKLDTPVRVLGLDENGQLVLETSGSSMRFRYNGRRIVLAADIVPAIGEIEDEISAQRFPGMQKTDRLVFGDRIISRHASIARSTGGRPLFPESLLLSTIVDQIGSRDRSDQILVGSSHFDTEIKYVEAVRDELFDFPLVDFVIDSSSYPEEMLVIGWNRESLQAVTINESNIKSSRLKDLSAYRVDLEGVVLEDISSRCIGSVKRTSFWRDLSNAGQYCTWNRGAV